MKKDKPVKNQTAQQQQYHACCLLSGHFICTLSYSLIFIRILFVRHALPTSPTVLVKPLPSLTTAYQRIDAFSPSLPLFDAASLRALEAALAHQLPEGALMACAGATAAHWVLAHYPAPAVIAILTGPGNNGGDGFVLARHLRSRGYTIHVYGDPHQVLPSDAAAARAAWLQDGGGIEAVLSSTLSPTLWVDALFGIGLSRALAPDSDYATWIHTANQSAAPILSLDIPSGLASDSGLVLNLVRNSTQGPVIIKARATLSFLGLKTGLWTNDAADYCGQIYHAPLIESNDAASANTPQVWLNTLPSFQAAVPRRAANSHKGSHGQVLVSGGQTGMEGAVLLAARGALFAGAGKVYVQVAGNDLPLRMAQPELLGAAACNTPDRTVYVIGPGLGLKAASQTQFEILLSQAHAAPAIVLDADALNCLAHGVQLASTLADVQQIAHEGLAACQGHRVLTPHPLEAARMLGVDVSEVQANRIEAARILAARYGAIVILKGSGTVIAHADGRCWLNPTGNAALATGGTGDVLSGLLGALLAQWDDPLAACLAAVWLHGHAADIWTQGKGGNQTGLSAGELPLLIRDVLNQI